MGRFRKLLDATATVKRFVQDHEEAIRQLLDANFSKATMSHLSDKRLLVPEATLRCEIQKIEQLQNRLESVRCSANGIELVVSGAVAGARISSTLILRIQDLVICEDRQEAIFSIEDKGIQGHGFWGRIVCCVAGMFIKELSKYVVENGSWSELIEFFPDGKRVSVALDHVPAVKKLCEQQVSWWEGSVPVHLVSVKGAEHCSDGVFILLEVSREVELVQSGVRNIATSVGVAAGVVRKVK